jgi:hypothetical protein
MSDAYEADDWVPRFVVIPDNCPKIRAAAERYADSVTTHGYRSDYARCARRDLAKLIEEVFRSFTDIEQCAEYDSAWDMWLDQFLPDAQITKR